MTQRRSRITRVAARLMGGLDAARRLTANLIFLLLLVALLGWWLGGRGPTVPHEAALLIAPSGVLVEERTGVPLDRALLGLLGEQGPVETLVQPLVDALDQAAGDERIAAVHLDLDRLLGGGLSKLQAVQAAILRFRSTGKRVVASADYLSQAGIFLARAADEVHLHPGGMALLSGYGGYRRYYRETIDRWEVEWNVFRVGEYKSAVEPFLRSDMSPEAREARLAWLGDLWRAYLDDLAAAGELDREEIEAYVESFPERLERQAGDPALAAREAGLVDRLSHRDELEARLVELVGEDEAGESYSRISHRAYLAAEPVERREGASDVALVVASGSISDGFQPPGTVGGDSTSALLRRAREDERVAAVVLRVDSPGGSVFASELIRREVELTRQAGKPVVASMSSVAASGGYWISMDADEIWAHPTTLTGSIGIYAMFPTFERTLEGFGVEVDGVGTTPLAGVLRLDRSLPEPARRVIRQIVDRGYDDFVTRAARARGMSVSELDRIARGRVWSGEDAVELGLVDRLGDLDGAIERAAELAELGEDWGVRQIEPRRSRGEQIVERLLGGAPRGVGRAIAVLLPATAGRGALDPLAAAAADPAMAPLLATLDPAARAAAAPLRLWAWCFCEVE